MKRLQISIEPELDAALGIKAAKEGRSKAAIVRDAVRKEVKPLPPIEEDPIWDLFGAFSTGGPVEEIDIDEIVYGPRGPEK